MVKKKIVIFIIAVIIAPFVGAGLGYTYSLFTTKNEFKNYPEPTSECFNKYKSSALEPNKNFEPGVISLQFKDEASMESINTIIEKYNIAERGSGWDYLKDQKWIVIKVPEGTERYWGCILESLPEVAYADLSLITKAFDRINLPSLPPSQIKSNVNWFSKTLNKINKIFSNFKKSSDNKDSTKKITFRIYKSNPISLDSEPKLLLWVSNKSLYNCKGYKILQDFDVVNKKIKVTLDKISNTNDCLATLNTTGSLEELNFTEGKYTLEFNSKNTTDTYSVNISKDVIKIEPIKETFTTTSSFEIKRVSNNLYLAKCFYSADWKLFNIEENYCKGFFSQLDKIGDPQSTPENGKAIKQQIYKFNSGKKLDEIKNKYSRENYIVDIIRADPNEVSLINKIEILYDEYHPTDISECKEDRQFLSITTCLQRVAYYTKNKEVCQLVDGERGKETCFFYATDINKDDIKSCYSNENPEKCYKNIFYIYQDPKLCRGVGNQNDRYYCYFYYAQVTNDKSFCEPVWILDDDLRKKCEMIVK